jgi:hypothetical protein
LIGLPQFQESQCLVILLGARRVALTSAAYASGLGRRLRPLPRFDGLLVVAQAFIGDSHPVRHLRIPRAGATARRPQRQVGRYRHGSFEIGQRFLVVPP